VPGPDKDDALFATRWVHIFEEDTADGEVYRPETDDVPLSRRPRRRLSLSPGGKARVLQPGPNDRLVETPASWEAEGDNLVIRSRAGGKRETVIRIRDRSPTRLVVSK
jgi:hypothetical protein